MKKIYFEYVKILEKTYIDPLSILITSRFFNLFEDTTYFIVTYIILAIAIHYPMINSKQ